MVVVEFAYEEMKGLVDLPREEMVESLSELGAPSEYEKETDKILTELTPNRPDWYSMEGLARALKAYLKDERPKYKSKGSDYKVVVDPSVAKVRPYTVCAVVKGLEFDDQRIRDAVLLQEKLLATLGRRVRRFGLGLYPMHAISFPVRYTTMKPKDIRYVPLGCEEEMDAVEVLEKHPKGEQYGDIIRGFDRYPVFVDAKDKVMALIPIVNSAETGKVDESTKDMFIEVTGTDLNACKAACNILVCTFVDMGGTAYDVTMEYKDMEVVAPDFTEKKMELDMQKVNRILGLELKEKEAKELLEKMGYEYRKGEVLIPSYRADVMSDIDVMEDIAIAYGYNNFKPTIPDFFSPGEADRRYDGLANIMKGMGFLETTTFILTNKEKLERVGCDKDVIDISNPNTQEYTVVRPTILADILDVFSINKMKGLPQRFFEVGVVHEKCTKKKLVFGIMDKGLQFSDFRGHVQTLASELGQELKLEKTKEKMFESETSCAVLLDGEKRGVLGKVDGKTLEQFNIGFDVYVCELDLI
jgi:phenylalanyl-tRNA synthetase beta chain